MEEEKEISIEDLQKLSREEINVKYIKLFNEYKLKSFHFNLLYKNIVMHAKSTASLFNSLNTISSNNIRLEIIEDSVSKLG